MFLDRVKKKLSPFLFKVGTIAAGLGFTPNLATGIGFVFLVLAAFLIYNQFLFYGGLALIINLFFDAIDGSTARATNKTTKLGHFFDRTADQCRQLIWIVLGLANFISLKLAILAVFLDAFGNYIAHFVEENQVKTLPWVPAWIGWIMFLGLLTGKVVFFTWGFIFLAVGLAIVQTISIAFLNRKNETEASSLANKVRAKVR